MKIKSYYASTDALYENFDAYISKLPENLKARILKKTNPDAKVCSLGGTLLLDIASKEFGADLGKATYSPKGKPYIPDSDFYFSISHTKGYAAVSFGKVPSGCDIQIEKDVNFKIAERFYSEKERAFVKDCPKEFFKIWSRKESLYKLTGGYGCTIENEHMFKDFILKDNLHFCICAENCEVQEPKLIDFNTVF